MPDARDPVATFTMPASDVTVSAEYAGRARGVRDAQKDQQTLIDPNAPAEEYVLGDVTMDGKINSSDARLALRAAAKVETLTELQQKLADVDADGKVKAGDARTILRIAAKLEPKPEKTISSAG